MRFWFHGWVAALALGAGCASPDPSRLGVKTPSAEEIAAVAGRAGLAADEIEQAVGIYNLKCARCHKFYHPADYDDAEWKSWMKKMSRKARLKPAQDQLLSRYLGAFRPANTGPTKEPDLDR